MRAIIIANGEINNISIIEQSICEGDYIIALDGGLKYVDKAGIKPNVIVGDFDSVDMGLVEKYRLKNVELQSFPVRKDFTDMEIGIDIAAKAGAEEIVLLGALGGRLDHALGNVLNMQQAANMGISISIIDEAQHVFLLKKGRKFKYKKDTTISIIPLTEQVTGVKTTNLSYPLNNETLFMGFSRGLSNVFDEDEAEIIFSGGILLVIVNV